MARVTLILASLLAGCGGDPCMNGISDGDESDVDCGGSCAAKCAPGQLCFVNTDCTAGVCAAGGRCPMPSCTDQIKNGRETDIDCGGGDCPGCGAERLCNGALDCASLTCVGNRCAADPRCSNGILDPGESDIDCGGNCDKCTDGHTCVDPSDCASAACTSGVCGTADPCSDGKRDGSESDVDCGGGCPGCAVGKRCNSPADCASGLCGGGLCAAPVGLKLNLSLATRVPTGTTDIPTWIAAGDFNGDGNLDLAVVAILVNSDSQVAVLLGDGMGGLGAATITPVPGVAETIGVGDWNGDGRSDVVVGSNKANVSLLEGSFGGQLAAPIVFDVADPMLVVAGDMAGAGRMDIAVVDQPNDIAQPATFQIYLGDGNGSFTTSATMTLGQQPDSGAIADFNDDGRRDLIFADDGDGGENGSLSVLFGMGGGLFQKSIETPAVRPLYIQVGDFDHNGKPDVYYWSDGKLVTRLGTGKGGFGAESITPDPNQPQTIALADLDRDGFPDLIALDAVGPAVSVFLCTGSGTFQPAVTYPSFGKPTAAAIGDFDGDGKPDLATAGDDGHVNLFLNTSK